MLKRYYSGLAAVSRLESQIERPIAHGADAQKEGASTLNHIMNILSLNAPRHIAIVGVSGSGKTTLAQQLARRLELRHVELDSLYWDPGWAKASAPVFRQRATQAF